MNAMLNVILNTRIKKKILSEHFFHRQVRAVPPGGKTEAVCCNLHSIKYSGNFAYVGPLPPGGKTEAIYYNLHFIKYFGYSAHVGHLPPGGGTGSHLL